MLKKLFNSININWRYPRSYSQSGEDVIVDFVFKCLGERHISYLDIGASDPVHINNTYLFYKKGFNGVLVEPDVELCEKIKIKRKRDLCLNIGAGTESREDIDFYIMSTKSLSTVSGKYVSNYIKDKIEKKVKISIKNINEIIRENFDNCPNFVSIDAEGLEYDIITSIDYEKYRPDVICVETLTYSENNTEKKVDKIIDFLKSKNYLLYADTYINSIFVDEKKWTNRKR